MKLYLYLHLYAALSISCDQAAQPAGLPQPKIVEKWELPGELLEVSATIGVDRNRVACVQDNEGSIYIYNLVSRSVENKIPFAGSGDYEGLALAGNTYYVLRSDGFLYEVDSQKGKASVKTYDLPLSAENDAESLFYDRPNNRLLIAVKEKDLTQKDKKGIYSFDLSSRKMSTEPVLTFSAGYNSAESGGAAAGDQEGKKKKKNKRGKKQASEIKPSEIIINQSTGEFYVLDGPSSRLFILDKTGNIKRAFQLDRKDFPQPEGMFISSSNELFISSEGNKKGNGIIAKVAL
ncbi:MAG TPA: SdiA-regulated domain-containing protein [Chitinophaga sp.]|uniref:SdiA-regulated domain-containing protein n=1 Tax=Chitinophaga sp. TaxID=1869181 RepID=UPI002F956325